VELGYASVHSKAAWCRYIGELGLHGTPEAFRDSGHAEATVLLEPPTSWTYPSAEELHKWVEGESALAGARFVARSASLRENGDNHAQCREDLVVLRQDAVQLSDLATKLADENRGQAAALHELQDRLDAKATVEYEILQSRSLLRAMEDQVDELRARIHLQDFEVENLRESVARLQRTEAELAALEAEANEIPILREKVVQAETAATDALRMADEQAAQLAELREAADFGASVAESARWRVVSWILYPVDKLRTRDDRVLDGEAGGASGGDA
jgi:hypothetical protein